MQLRSPSLHGISSKGQDFVSQAETNFTVLLFVVLKNSHVSSPCGAPGLRRSVASFKPYPVQRDLPPFSLRQQSVTSDCQPGAQHWVSGLAMSKWSGIAMVLKGSGRQVLKKCEVRGHRRVEPSP